MATSDVFWPNIGKFRFWLSCQIAGRPLSFTYHYGFLPLDRGQWLWGAAAGIENAGARYVACPEVEDMAALAWAAHERGEVELVQRRLGAERFEYIAIRRAGALGKGDR